jgi:hypothetical protein
MLRIGSIAALAGLVPAIAAGPAYQGTAHMHPAAKLNAGAFRIEVSAHYGRPGNASGYSVILVTGRRDSWAFGGTNPGGPSAPVAEHWTGRGWRAVALPGRLTSFITDASAPSGRDIWAASEYGGYVLHWNGSRWAVARRWRGGLISGLTAISATDVWVFGTTAAGARGIGTWHYNGASWRQVSGPAGYIYRANATSRRDIWAIAADGNSWRILHFDGSAWRSVPARRVLSGIQPQDILALSKRDVWLVGNAVSPTGAVRLILAHWNGSAWSRLPSRVSDWAGRLAAGPNGSVLVTATPAVGSSPAGLVLQATAAGWLPSMRVGSALGSGVSDVAVLRGGRALWASGGILTRQGGDAAIWEGPLARAAADDDT